MQVFYKQSITCILQIKRPLLFSLGRPSTSITHTQYTCATGSCYTKQYHAVKDHAKPLHLWSITYVRKTLDREEALCVFPTFYCPVWFELSKLFFTIRPPPNPLQPYYIARLTLHLHRVRAP